MLVSIYMDYNISGWSDLHDPNPIQNNHIIITSLTIHYTNVVVGVFKKMAVIVL